MSTAGSRAWSRPRPRSAWSTARRGGCSTAATRSATWPLTAATTAWSGCCSTASGRCATRCCRRRSSRRRCWPRCAGCPPRAPRWMLCARAFSAFGAERRMDWPPTAEQARELIALGPAAVGAFARLRDNKQPVNSAESAHLGSAARLLHAITGEEPDPAKARALDAYFTVCAEHGLNASTFTARVITSTQSDLASAVCGAVGALKGRLHGGAPSEVRDQLTQIGDVEHAEVWIREALARGERLMGFGHRVYKTMDPRAARAAAGGGAAGCRRRLAAAGDRRRGRGATAAGRAQARPAAEDQRRVLRLDRAGRSRAADRPLHAGIRGRPHRRAGRRTRWSRPTTDG